MTMLRLPEQLGQTKLAYITDKERKQLRRRDAMKGAIPKTSQGVPVLDDAAERDRARAARISAKHGYKDQYAGMADPKKDYKKYVSGSPDLAQAYKDLSDPTSKTAKYWLPRIKGPVTAESFGQAHAGESKALETDTYRGKTSVKDFKARAVPDIRKKSKVVDLPPKVPKKGGEEISRPGGGQVSQQPADWDLTPIFDQSKLNQPLLEEIVMLGPKSEVLEERLRNLIDTNSELFKSATTKALQAMGPHGLINSSMAQEAVMSAILSVAIPIAERDATAFMTQRMANQNMSNSFKAAQNQAYYEAFVTKLTGTINLRLRQLSEEGANWRAILGERGAIARTSGMSKDAAANAMRAVTPGWFQA